MPLWMVVTRFSGSPCCNRAFRAKLETVISRAAPLLARQQNSFRTLQGKKSGEIISLTHQTEGTEERRHAPAAQKWSLFVQETTTWGRNSAMIFSSLLTPAGRAPRPRKPCRKEKRRPTTRNRLS